jgi:hypothetical protein
MALTLPAMTGATGRMLSPSGGSTLMISAPKVAQDLGRVWAEDHGGQIEMRRPSRRGIMGLG